MASIETMEIVEGSTPRIEATPRVRAPEKAGADWATPTGSPRKASVADKNFTASGDGLAAELGGTLAAALTLLLAFALGRRGDGLVEAPKDRDALAVELSDGNEVGEGEAPLEMDDVAVREDEEENDKDEEEEGVTPVDKLAVGVRVEVEESESDAEVEGLAPVDTLPVALRLLLALSDSEPDALGDAPADSDGVAESVLVELIDRVAEDDGLAPVDTLPVALRLLLALSDSEPDALGDAPADSDGVAESVLVELIDRVAEDDGLAPVDTLPVALKDDDDDNDSDADCDGKAPSVTLLVAVCEAVLDSDNVAVADADTPTYRLAVGVGDGVGVLDGVGELEADGRIQTLGTHAILLWLHSSPLLHVKATGAAPALAHIGIAVPVDARPGEHSIATNEGFGAQTRPVAKFCAREWPAGHSSGSRRAGRTRAGGTQAMNAEPHTSPLLHVNVAGAAPALVQSGTAMPVAVSPR